ncbi:MAG: hypothetical protein JW941_11035 [Candidatus Coatesbacteria bacterium]|nr:hypothetical protein [Candidatus Coatesbacteria bacterium]
MMVRQLIFAIVFVAILLALTLVSAYADDGRRIDGPLGGDSRCEEAGMSTVHHHWMHIWTTSNGGRGDGRAVHSGYYWNPVRDGNGHAFVQSNASKREHISERKR